MPLLLPVCFHVISDLGYVFIAPVSTALYTAEAPGSLRGTMLGLSTLTIFLAGLMSGWLGGLDVTLPASSFWMGNAAIVGGAGVLLALFGPFIARLFAIETPAAIGRPISVLSKT